MTLAVGDRIPDVQLTRMTADGPAKVSSVEVLGTGTVVLFAVPGAFTPTCNDYHLPGYVLRAEELAAKGVDTIACIAVNDVFVMSAWGDAVGVGDKVVMLADGSGEFARSAGLELDLSAGGLGLRSRRYAAVIRDGVVSDLLLEEGGKLENSTADRVLTVL